MTAIRSSYISLEFHDQDPLPDLKTKIEELINNEMKSMENNKDQIDQDGDSIMMDGNFTEQNGLKHIHFPSETFNIGSLDSLDIIYGYDKLKNPLLYELDMRLRNGDKTIYPDNFTPLERQKIDFMYKSLEYQNLLLLKENYNELYPFYLNILQNVQNTLQYNLSKEKNLFQQIQNVRKNRNISIGKELDRMNLEFEKLKLEENFLSREIQLLRSKFSENYSNS